MPPYTKPTSEKQRRFMFVLEREGKLAPGEAIGKSRAVQGKRLPMRAKRKRGRKRGR